MTWTGRRQKAVGNYVSTVDRQYACKIFVVFVFIMAKI
jgi:hypothetical protein